MTREQERKRSSEANKLDRFATIARKDIEGAVDKAARKNLKDVVREGDKTEKLRAEILGRVKRKTEQALTDSSRKPSWFRKRFYQLLKQIDLVPVPNTVEEASRLRQRFQEAYYRHSTGAGISTHNIKGNRIFFHISAEQFENPDTVLNLISIAKSGHAHMKLKPSARTLSVSRNIPAKHKEILKQFWKVE